MYGCVSSILWDLFDPANDDTFSLGIKNLWDKINSDKYDSVAELYSFLKDNSVDAANLFGAVGYCVDDKIPNNKCDSNEDRGKSNWDAFTTLVPPHLVEGVEVPPLLFNYPDLRSSPSDEEIPEAALHLEFKDDGGQPVNNVLILVEFTEEDGTVWSYEGFSSESDTLFGFHINDLATASIKFLADGFESEEITFDSDEYMNGYIDTSTPNALGFSITFKPSGVPIGSGGGGGGDKTAPNFKSMSVFGAKSLQEDGTYGFGGILEQEILLTNDMPTAIIEAGTDVTFRLLLYENSGKQGLNHITLYILDQADVTVQQSEEFLRYDDGKITLKDSNGIFSNGNISFVERGGDLEVVFEFTAKNPMPLSDIIIRAWDYNRNMEQAKFYDAIEIVPSSEETVEFGGKIEGQQPLWSNEMLSGWAGYSENSVSDSELLSQIGIEGQQIPSWFKNKMAKWVIDGTVTHQELVNAMKFFENIGLLT